MPADFTPYSPSHAAVIVLLIAANVAAVVARRRLGDAPPGRRIDLLYAAANLAFWLVASLWPIGAGEWDFSRSLPLQVCDLSAIVAVVAMSAGHRFARAMLFYVGIGLSSWALCTPDLAFGPARLQFWVFFLGHGATVGAAAYDVAARGYRPGWRDCGLAVAGMLAWLAVVLPVNAAFGWNYGYTGNALADNTNPIHFLGPWPWRVLWLALGVIALFVAMTVPFRFTRHWRWGSGFRVSGFGFRG